MLDVEKDKTKFFQMRMAQGRPDDFQTPAEAIEPLIKFLNKDWIVWECACGKGNLVKGFESKEFKVIGTDKEFNFLLNQPEEFDCIITNPPFSLKTEFIARAYNLKKPFAFLLPLTTLEGQKRQAFFKRYGIEVILFDKRINFETPSGSGSGSWFATAWFTWGLNIGKDLTFVKLNDRQGILL